VISKSRIKQLSALQQKKYRDTEKCYIAEGIKMVNEAINYHPGIIELVLFTSDCQDKLDLSNLIDSALVDQETIHKISSFKTPQPCLAVLKMPVEKSFQFEPTDEFVLALESIRDPGNLGTIIRLADWFGISKIVCSPDTVDCYNPKVVQASMGAILRAGIFYCDLKNFLDKARIENYSIYGATLEGENIYQTKLQFPLVLVMGNESEGISGSFKQMLTKELLIPNYSSKSEKTESLNVSTATSIILSELRRVQNYSK
jgi:RNA methyltransferase, TrmH family